MVLTDSVILNDEMQIQKTRKKRSITQSRKFFTPIPNKKTSFHYKLIILDNNIVQIV